jgi:hypothetical protein
VRRLPTPRHMVRQAGDRRRGVSEGLEPTSRACTRTILGRLSKSGSESKGVRPKRIAVRRVMAWTKPPRAPPSAQAMPFLLPGVIGAGGPLVSRPSTAAGLAEFVPADRCLPLTEQCHTTFWRLGWFRHNLSPALALARHHSARHHRQLTAACQPRTNSGLLPDTT